MGHENETSMVGLKKKLFILYGVTFVLPMLFMIYSVLQLYSSFSSNTFNPVIIKWAIGAGLSASLVMSVSAFYFLYPSLRRIIQVTKAAETFVREAGSDKFQIASSGDEAERLAQYTDQMIRELKVKLSDVTECANQLDVANRSLTQRALSDGLTGLYNQTHIKQCIVTEIANAQRAGKPLSVVMLDVNGFKRYNDSYGHLQGDRALKEIANAIRDTVRSGDIASRYGGDEFLVVLPTADRTQARRVASRIREAIAERHIGSAGLMDTTALKVTAGTATYPEEAASAEELIRSADNRLYRERGTTIISVDEIKRTSSAAMAATPA
ncbi:GGDEF domain-containing protein [Planctomycetota bacterium]